MTGVGLHQGLAGHGAGLSVWLEMRGNTTVCVRGLHISQVLT